MCYSAQVIQLIRESFLRSGIRLDYSAARELFLQRRDDPGITISRAFEANFETPRNEEERSIKALIEDHRNTLAGKWESDLFTQKTRLVAAERKLKEKVTKAAQNEVRVSTNKIEALTSKLSNLRRIEPKPSDARIYPMQYTGVIIKDEGGYVLTPMRYHCRPQDKPAFYDRKFPGLYNARRDNLEAFWKDHFGKHHALAIVERFFENVKLHDLERRELAAGEKDQNIVLQFQPRPAKHMLIACLWSHWRDPNEPDLRSFAIITDDPPPEVAAAGHNRCPINLKESNVEAWLTPAGHSLAELQAILGDREQPYYDHQVLAA